MSISLDKLVIDLQPVCENKGNKCFMWIAYNFMNKKYIVINPDSYEIVANFTIDNKECYQPKQKYQND